MTPRKQFLKDTTRLLKSVGEVGLSELGQKLKKPKEGENISREEFEASRDMILATMEEVEKITKKLAALEAKLAKSKK